MCVDLNAIVIVNYLVCCSFNLHRYNEVSITDGLQDQKRTTIHHHQFSNPIKPVAVTLKRQKYTLTTKIRYSVISREQILRVDRENLPGLYEMREI